MATVMRCKMTLISVVPKPETGNPDMHGLYFGAVWEGSSEKQQASENAIFGKMTPAASFTANVCNRAVIDQLQVGKHYYVDFSQVEPETGLAD